MQQYRVWFRKRGESRWKVIEADSLEEARHQALRKYEQKFITVVPIRNWREREGSFSG